MNPENTQKQENSNRSFNILEHWVYQNNEDLPEEMLAFLVEDIDNPISFNLLVTYIKKKIKTRLPDVMRRLNFSYCVAPESYDAYIDFKQKIENLLAEKDGIIDTNKRETARLLFKAIKSVK